MAKSEEASGATLKDISKALNELERRITILEDTLEKKRRDDNDLLYNLDESNFSEGFLKKLKEG